MPLDHTKIRARREELKLTQDEAAKRAGMPQPHWARVESGRRPNPSVETAEKIATALKLRLDKLLTDSDS